MNRNFILLSLVILLIHSISTGVYGQNSITDPLINEIVEQSGYSGEELKNDRKTSYQYDIRNNTILEQQLIWSNEVSNWIISSEEFSEFDQNNNRSFIHIVNYLDYPEKLNERMEIREYEYGLVKYRDITIKDYITDTSDSVRLRQFDVFYEYNENGDRTEFRVHYTLGTKFLGGYGFRWYFNPNYCETAFVDYNIDEQLNVSVVDSTSTVRDSWCNITQQTKYEFSQGYFDQYSDNLYEYEYDQKGNILSYKEYQRIKSYENWQEVVVRNFTYNDSDMQTSIQEFNFLANREKLLILIYDFQDRLIQQTEEVKESPEEDWMMEADFTWFYNDMDQLEKVVLKSDWNSIGGIYNIISITDYLFDSDGNNYQINSDRNLNGARTLKEEIREFRCDGNEVTKTISTRNYINGTIVLNIDRVTTSYFNQAPCEIPESISPEFTIYPNPANSYFRIYNDDAFGDSRLRLLNASGHIIREFQGSINNYFNVDVSTIEPGLYFVQIETVHGKFSQKFVKK